MKLEPTKLFALLGFVLSLPAVGCGSSLGNCDAGACDGGGPGTGGSGGGGGGSSGGPCGVTPCGGNVVGNWRASSACVDKATLDMEFLSGIMDSCPTASLGNVGMTPVGNISLAADMTFTAAFVVNTTIPINFPAACTNGATCAQLTQALQSVVGSNGITSANCTGSSGCTCTMAQTLDVINDTGTWATSGTTLSFTGATSLQSGPYCVQGTTLHLVDVDASTMMKVVGDIVLSKQ